MNCLSMKCYNGNIVPCGKCAYCLVNKRSSWQFRIFHEMRTQDHRGYFMTFTYDERHVKRTDQGKLSLRFKDIQLFMKRLRKAKYYAKYICVGEYGPQTLRPHYHAILWTDAPVSFLDSNWKSSRDGSLLGRIQYGTLTMASAMYCLKYIIQPKQQAIDGVEKTRAQFSKGIGIGYQTEAVIAYHSGRSVVDPETGGGFREDQRFYSIIDGRKVALPKYFKDRWFTKAEKKVEAWKNDLRQRKKKRELYVEYRAQGVKDTRLHYKQLRIERAQRIIENTKYGVSL